MVDATQAVILGAVAAIAWPLFNLFRILFSDADLNLLSRGPPRKDAFKDKVVWITGASQGIGEDLAKGFAALGAKLILSSRNVSNLTQVKANCSGPHAPGDIVVLPLDLAAGPNALKIAVEAAEAAFGGAGVDVLVHNAAYPRPKYTLLDSSDEFMRATFEVNVFGTVELSRQLLPHMLERHRGQFIVVSSAAGKLPAPTQGVYAASKHALQGYFHTLASEVAGSGVGVTLVCPGPIASADQTSADAGDKKAYEKDRMTCQRCADLIIASAAHRVSESWVSTQPVLLVLYVAQYFPRLTTWLFTKIGPKRVTAMKSGSKDLYGTNLLFPGSQSGAKKDK